MFCMQEAESCMDHPILSYPLSFQNSMETYLFNETGVVLSPEDGLEDNQKYVYTLTAINSVGNATSHNKILCELLLHLLYYSVTSDVEESLVSTIMIIQIHQMFTLSVPQLWMIMLLILSVTSSMDQMLWGARWY